MTMVIVLLRTRLRPDADRAAYDALNGEMYEIASAMPGFLGAAGFAASEGDEIGVVRFASLDTLRAWRDHPRHVATQERGRSELYASYSVEVCEVVRSYTFDRAD